MRAARTVSRNQRRGVAPGRPAFTATWGRLPLRIRLVAGFATAILLVLTAAGAFVYLRVRYALDLRLNEDLMAQSAQIIPFATSRHGTASAVAAVPPGSYFQVLDAGNHVRARSPGAARTSLLRQPELTSALRRPLHEDRGTLIPVSARPLRLYAVPLAADAAPPAGQPAVVVVAVRRDQRDEALRELVGQLALANIAALVISSLVGYRLARVTLMPVERYRAEAARIAGGAVGVRLVVPATSHDEVARLGRTLNDMLAALESSLDRERRFVNDASHELRTPLTLLSTELELALRRPRTPAEMEQTVRAAAADTADLIALADTLLEVGVPPLHGRDAAEVHLSGLVIGLVDRYRAAGTTPDRALRTDTAPGLTVRGDAARLGRVLTNLLDNAVRYGAGTVTVTTYEDETQAVLAVHDDGPGMDPLFLPHATERFSRADTARTSPGTGLGLSLVESIVQAHHGGLRICSGAAHHHVDGHLAVTCHHPGTGTTVTVLLPKRLPIR